MKYRNEHKKTENKKKIKDYKWIANYLGVERINLEARIGLEDVFVTAMAVPILSTVMAIILQKYFSQSMKIFSLKPIYNKMFFGVKGAVYVSIKLKDFLYIVFKEFFTNKK